MLLKPADLPIQQPTKGTDERLRIAANTGAAFIKFIAYHESFGFSWSQSRPTLSFVASICVRDVGGFPWTNGFDYDSDSGEYTLDFMLHAPGFGAQEVLQLSEFGGELFEFVDRI